MSRANSHKSRVILGMVYVLDAAFFAVTLQPINLLPIGAVIAGSLAGAYAARIASRSIGSRHD